MRRLSVVLFAAVFVLAFTPSASTADLPVKAPATTSAIAAPRYDWSGFYIGGHFGYLWGRTHVEENGAVTEPSAKTDGIIGGGIVGYNWQSGTWVVGAECDFGWTHAHGVGAIVTTTTTTQAPNTYDANWTGHARGRVGYAFDNWLFYGAGGFAVADLDFQEGAITTAAVVAPGGKYYGWSVGGGEFAFTRNLVGRVEYLYDDYGHKDYTSVTGNAYRISLTGQTLRGALSWKFDPIGM